MWAAGHLVASGQSHALFDLGQFNAALQSMFGAGFPQQAWPYPPPILLLVVPLSALPLLPGFLLYTAGTIGLLWLALRSGGITRAASTAVLFSPAVIDNALTGQNGSLTAAMLYGGLFLTDRRPFLAGTILGALVIKPQFGLLVPLCLMACGNWRALFGMVVSAGLLILASGILFGLDTWVGFLVHTRPIIAAILEAPWQATPAQRIFASFLMATRSLGASIEVAYSLQIAVTLLCAAIAWWAWRTPHTASTQRVALTGLLTVAASPWVHTYDMIPLSVAIVVLIATGHRSSSILFGFAWFWPGAAVLLPMPLPVSVASTAALALRAWKEMRFGATSHHETTTIAAAVTRFRRPAKSRAARQT
jgi:hypothetical protein